jgi:Gas vesicle protein K
VKKKRAGTRRRANPGANGRAGQRTRKRIPQRRKNIPAGKTGPALRWNPDPEDVQKSVVKLVLSLIEFIRKLMERQAVRRLEEKTLSSADIENVGIALMKLEETVHLIAKRFNLTPEDLNLDLGPIGRLH